ncbi:MAG TPA: DUF2723 domain-containing protein, partial [Candidatus Angelobacter sp.]|nr:DUF2723 domain-containing protein [Candidatus Angelobacter sp.]
MENQERSGFVQSRLPWLITAAALIVYVLTLNRWVSLSSLPVISNVSSRELVPPIGQPLRFLVLLPFRWLPVAGQPIALNVFTALCAALTLGLLGRSVALLPHDRTREQRQRERSKSSLLSIPAAWVPPVFAVMACGLQLTFWEHATAATGEMFDLLLFAYVVRCLLEYRIDQCECWLTRSALVYGIAITNNYAMVGFFPVYLAALIWMKGLSFVEFRFVTKMFGWGTAGLTLYLLPPLINAFGDQAGAGFWQSLRYELTSQKGALLGFPRYLILIAGLTSLLPLLLIGIRWPSTFGETSPTGGMITTFLFRVVHTILLVAGIWVAFDAPFGPRMLMEQLLQQTDDPLSTVPFLTFYYLGALCLGYFAGYFLLVFGQETAKSWTKVSAATRLCNRAVTGAIWLAAIGTPVGLVYKNLGAIRATDGSLLRDFARLATLGLPKPDFIALSDDPYVLALVQGNLPHVEGKPDPILTDTRLLRYTPYQESLHRRFPERWPALPATVAPLAQVDPVFLIYEMSGMAKSNETYYLNPSFGYYFEPLYLEPHGMVYRLVPYATNAIAPPRLSEQTVAENQRFWNEAGPILDRVTALIGREIGDARAVGRWYSRALNWWGVDLQKLGRIDDASRAFARARRLNPQNVAVEINSDFNQTLRTGATAPAKAKGNLEERVGRYRDWNSLLAANGPIDDPEVCFRLAQTFASQSLFRQSALQLMRVLQLDPDNLDARFLLAGVFLAGG